MQAESDDSIWTKSFKKAIQNNRQLSFSQNMFLSAITSEGDDCDLDMLRLRNIEKCEFTEGDTPECFVFDCDLRSDFTGVIRTDKAGKLIGYFPLSKEKFKIQGELHIVDSSNGTKLSEVREKIWAGLEKEEKNQYKEWQPDKPKLETDSLNTFNNPESSGISQHFALCIIRPTRSTISLT